MLAKVDVKDHQSTINTLIIGWNNEAANLYDRILNAPALGYNIKGFIRPAGMQEDSFYKNVPVVGDISTLSKTIESNSIDEVLIVLSPSEQQFLTEILSECKKTETEYRVVADAYDAAYKHVVRDVIKQALKPGEFGVRRVIDFLGSLFMIILLFPLFIIVALAIKIESPGTIFYSQQRCGKDGKIFPVFKFRSMVQNAEKISGPVWAQKNDPRITKLGRFMRKTRIDELPQLMNIIRGDMSFIGPRPERPFFVDSFKKQIPMYINRLKVKPGVTGLAQVTVGYDETLEDVKAKISADIKYIEQADSWKMNIWVLWKTVFVVLLGEGQ
ncbi:MAG: sugar transferase [Calditrichaeota bacterium]|nr:MAG: sugar transferase [Calditrichota bacterium]MBL1206361.1 sugar transferase [Calditrichota bacterium]NOG46187.1 sugar transferase [Calditrichota bacterium]